MPRLRVEGEQLVICVQCKKEMLTARIGYGVRFGAAHYYAGDMLRCPGCGKEVIQTAQQAFHNVNLPALKIEDKED